MGNPLLTYEAAPAIWDHLPPDTGKRASF